MSKHNVPTIYPPLIDDERFSRNGMVPNAALMRNLALRFNYVGARARKHIITRCQPLDAVMAGSAGDNIWPFFFHTGEGAIGLRVIAGIALSDGWSGYPIAPPEFAVFVKDPSDGSTVVSKSWKYGGATTGTTVAPSDVHHINDIVAGLSADTSYYGTVSVTNYVRAIWLSISEQERRHADDTVTALCDPAEFVAEGPIYDAQVLDLVDASNKQWRHNGAHLVSYTCPYEEGGGMLTSAFGTPTTYTNVVDASSTSVSAASAGYQLVTQYHNTTNRTTVPVKFAAKVDRTAGAGTLDVRITDGTNSVSITGISGTPAIDGWTTTTSTIPAQAAGTKWDIQARVSAAGTTYEIQAVSLFEYEA